MKRKRNPETEKTRSAHVHISEELLRYLYVHKGHSTLTIAKMLGCSQDTISRRLRLYGIEPRSNKKVIPEDELCELYLEKKWSVKKISEFFNCSQTTISHRLHDMGLMLPVKVIDYSDKEEEIIRAYNSGNSASFISKSMGLSRWLILKVLKRNGIYIRGSIKKDLISARELKELYLKRALTTLEIADIYGVKPATISDRLREAHIKLRGNRIIFDTDDLLTRYNIENQSIAKIAEAYSCSYGAVKKKLEDLGVYYKKNRLNLDEAAIIALYVEKKYTMAQIASRYNCCENSVLKVLKKHNIPRRLRGTRVKRLI